MFDSRARVLKQLVVFLLPETVQHSLCASDLCAKSHREIVLSPWSVCAAVWLTEVCTVAPCVARELVPSLPEGLRYGGQNGSVP